MIISSVSSQLLGSFGWLWSPHWTIPTPQHRDAWPTMVSATPRNTLFFSALIRHLFVLIGYGRQEHPTTVFCKISVRRRKYCPEFSISWERQKIYRWPFYSCAILKFKFNTIFWSLIFHISLPRLGYFSYKKGNLIKKLHPKSLGKKYWSPCNFERTQVPLGWPKRYTNLIALLRMHF